MQGSNELALSALLTEELAESKRMLEILDEERGALQDSQLDALNAAIKQKIEATESLYGLERKRAEILLQKGYSFDLAGMNECLRQQKDAMLATKLWDELLDITKKCQYQNRLNGAVVQAAQRRTQGLIGILRGEAKTLSTYCANGKQSAFSAGQRSLGSV